MEKVDIIIIGAGVVGLAVAESLSSLGKSVIVIEKHLTFGQETSSRNSEVIHSGIYYKNNSYKARLCVEGKNLLYDFCKEHNIPHKKIGKLIVAINHQEVQDLDLLMENGKRNGLDDLEFLTKNQVEKIEPQVSAIAAIDSPSTGILDVHQFMKKLESLAKSSGAIFAYSSEVTNVKRVNNSYEVTITESDDKELIIKSNIVINSAGLFADKIAEMVGIDIEESGYKIYYNKGEYFRVSNEKASFTERMIYPTPRKYSLGVHTVKDLQGQLKLGPNAFYVDELTYDVNPGHKLDFYEYVKGFLPFIEIEDLSADTSGIRAKIQAPQEESKDFIITDEKDKGLPGFINLIGIESPGLTASLSLAKYIKGML